MALSRHPQLHRTCLLSGVTTRSVVVEFVIPGGKAHACVEFDLYRNASSYKSWGDQHPKHN